MKLPVYLTSALLLLVSTSAGAVVWHPTSGDTDFIQLNIGAGPGMGISTNGGILALFDDDDGLDPSQALEIGESGGEVVFTDLGGGTWNAAVHGNSIELANGNSFILGISWDLGLTYHGDTDSFLVGEDSWIIVFDGFIPSGPGQGQEPISGSTLAIDLQPIPVPAAVWLFGSGLIGLVAVARRRA